MPINSTLQVAGFCMAVVALIMAMVTCSKYKNIRFYRVFGHFYGLRFYKVLTTPVLHQYHGWKWRSSNLTGLFKWNHIGNKMIDPDKWWRIFVGLKGCGRNVPHLLLVLMPAINSIILSLVSWPVTNSYRDFERFLLLFQGQKVCIFLALTI